MTQIIAQLSLFAANHSSICIIYSIFQRWNLRVRKPRLTETTALADEDDEEEEEEEEEMEEGDIVQETSIKPVRGRPPTTSHAHTSTSSAANTSVKKTPAGRRPQQKKREGAELKAPPSKRRQGAAVSAGAGATPGGVASGGGAGGGVTPSLAVLQMRKESRGYGMYQSVLSGKGALKVYNMQVYILEIDTT